MKHTLRLFPVGPGRCLAPSRLGKIQTRLASPLAVLSLFLSTSCGTGNRLALAWEEDFEGSALDEKTWSRTTRGTADWNNTQSQDPALLEVRDGMLVLKGIKNPKPATPAELPDGRISVECDTAAYLTAGVVTAGKHLFAAEGRLEIRARLFGARGAWPAIWLLPDERSGGWPHGGEIDIMERLNHDGMVYQTVHTTYSLSGHENEPPHYGTNTIRPDEFNVYAVEFHPDSLVFSVNGIRTFAYPRVPELEKADQFPFLHPWYLLIDMQLGGNWVGKVAPEELPVEMHIDWVRHYLPKSSARKSRTAKL